MANDAIPDPKAIDWARKDAARKDFSRHANLAFLIKCFGIGAIALLIPITLPIVGGYDGHFSISFFYHVPEARNWFVGLLWAVGIFLVLFQGLSRAENLLLRSRVFPLPVCGRGVLFEIQARLHPLAAAQEALRNGV